MVMAIKANFRLATELAALTEPVPNGCWRNSLNALYAFRLASHAKVIDTVYVEGWLRICDGAVAIEHGWLEIEGEIVDVTLPDIYAPEMYHAVHRYDMDGIGRQLNREVYLPFFGNDKKATRRMQEVCREIYSQIIEKIEREVASA